jgi:hypothetical protein
MDQLALSTSLLIQQLELSSSYAPDLRSLVIERLLTLHFFICKVFQTYVGKRVERYVLLFGIFFCISKAAKPSRFQPDHGCGAILGNGVSPKRYWPLRASKYHKQRLYWLRHTQLGRKVHPD